MTENVSGGSLSIVSVPIGNLGDISERAKMILSTANIIACEDTRVTGKLLDKLKIEKRGTFISYREENEKMLAEQLVSEIQSGKTIALVSDAGTPAISDPGFRLISACRKANVAITALPGACAIINALALSGLPTDSFLYQGFLPPKTSARRKFFETHSDLPYTIIIYESCHRIEKCIGDIVSTLGNNRIISVCREMTKLHETVFTGTAKSVLEQLSKTSKKGEFVILIAKQKFTL
ncbi:MAG: 16S rRNA (cytidine(1402)-2'-O)-methyltransferase [Coraliomargaritaceae bacterium]|jgi:16S rRNA (cytidine1402-2'-O)-methyltransferase